MSRQVLTVLVLAGRSLSLVALASILDVDLVHDGRRSVGEDPARVVGAVEQAIEELVDAGFVRCTAGLISISPLCLVEMVEGLVAEASADIRLAVAARLVGDAGASESNDAWAYFSRV